MIDKELYQYIRKHQPNICQISVLQDGNEICSAEWNGYQRTDCVCHEKRYGAADRYRCRPANDRQRG